MKSCPWCLGTGRITVMGLYGISHQEMCPRCVGQGIVTRVGFQTGQGIRPASDQ